MDSAQTPQTIGEALAWAQKKLADSAISNARNEALWLLSYSLSGDRGSQAGQLYHQKEKPLSDSQFADYGKIIERRSSRTPLAHLLQSQEFMGRDFKVTEDTLIPRPETEMLVKASAPEIQDRAHPRVFEIGTGSGCIAISLAILEPHAEILAADRSAKALEVARHNAGERRIHFVESDLYSCLNASDEGAIDLIVSNPPYIATDEISTLEPEVQAEPRLALDGGADGLRVIEPIISGAPKFLKDGGVLLLEIGYAQAERVRKMMKETGFVDILTRLDSGCVERVIGGTWRKNG